MNEFDIIERYFASSDQSNFTQRKFIAVAMGDDAAVVKIPKNMAMVTSVDTLNCGVHFPEQTAAMDIGYKSLAVSLSDIAAMAAEPFTVLLSLTLPSYNAQWLEDFSAGFFQLANHYQVSLIGGDTTRGPLAVTTIVNGLCLSAESLLRSGAKVGDKIFVSGTLGDAGLALKRLQQHNVVADDLLVRLNRPTPRVELGKALRGRAYSAIDISDGLIADLTKLANSSGVGANIYAEQLPMSDHLQALDKNAAQRLALTAGDDYELCFTMPVKAPADAVCQQLSQAGLCQVSCIGDIVSTPGVTVYDSQHQPMSLSHQGYDHFL